MDLYPLELFGKFERFKPRGVNVCYSVILYETYQPLFYISLLYTHLLIVPWNLMILEIVIVNRRKREPGFKSFTVLTWYLGSLSFKRSLSESLYVSHSTNVNHRRYKIRHDCKIIGILLWRLKL